MSGRLTYWCGPGRFGIARLPTAKSRVTHETNIRGMGRAVGTALLTGSIVDLAHSGSPLSALVRRGLTRRSRHAVSELAKKER